MCSLSLIGTDSLADRSHLPICWKMAMSKKQKPCLSPISYLALLGTSKRCSFIRLDFRAWNGAEHVSCDLITSSAVGKTPRSARQNVEAILSPSLMLARIIEIIQIRSRPFSSRFYLDLFVSICII